MKKIIIFLSFVISSVSLFAQKDSTKKDTSAKVEFVYSTVPQVQNYQIPQMRPDVYTTQQVPAHTEQSAFMKLKDGLLSKIMFDISPTGVEKTKTSVILTFEEMKITLTKDEYINYLECVIRYKEIYGELLELIHNLRRQMDHPVVPYYSQPPVYRNGGGW